VTYYKSPWWLTKQPKNCWFNLIENLNVTELQKVYTLKLAHLGIRSPVLKGHSCPVIASFISIVPLLRPLFLCHKYDLFIKVWLYTVSYMCNRIDYAVHWSSVIVFGRHWRSDDREFRTLLKCNPAPISLNHLTRLFPTTTWNFLLPRCWKLFFSSFVSRFS
jgi:hypothetical protein